MGRGSSKIGGGSGGGGAGGQDNSYAYTRNMSREDAHEEIVNKLLHGDNPVILEKDGHFAVANGWDEADYAIKNYGWKYSPDSPEVSSELGQRSRNIKSAFPDARDVRQPDTSRHLSADGITTINDTLRGAGFARMQGTQRGPYRSRTSSDQLIDLIGSDGRIYTGTWDRYSDGSVDVHSIKLRSKKTGARRS